MPKDDDFRREVASRLKEARRERTLTQRQLADLGLSTQQNISRYEKGYIPDSWFLLARIHAEKAIDLNWLLGVSASGSSAFAAAVAAQAGTTGGSLPAAVLSPVASCATPPSLASDGNAGASPGAAISMTGAGDGLSVAGESRRLELERRDLI